MRAKLGKLAATRLEEFRTRNPEYTDTEVPPEKANTSYRPDGRDVRITKTVRMRLRYSEMLRDVSYQRSVETGDKVSEADLIDEALTEWSKKHKIPAD